MKEIENFRTNLRRVIESSWPSQEKFADEAEISRPYLNKVLCGISSPSMEICSKLAEPSGFELRDLILPPREFRDLFNESHAGV